jgi:hypothetical protein
VNQWWSSNSFQGSSSFVLARKLKALKLNLKKMELGGIWQCREAEKGFFG